ncbi:ATP-binding protein [Nonomuraea sp. NPDC050536]|uniref:ATP-binding protein n=1 Tax=Nonomuraea sp. NPDC050536 TaxID=3364366 RepID=UPI0037C778F7
MTFGHSLKALRLAAGLTQEGLAERAGISARAVSDLERDPVRTPRMETVALLAAALGVERERLTRGAHGLPRPLTPLIGREGVTAALVDILRRGETRLLTLTGPGGVGKTRLALEVADRLPDEAVFVDLAPLREPRLVIAAVAARFGLDERDAVPVQQRLVAALRERRVLVLLDNFEHVAEARADLLDLLGACPGVTALVTSRIPLRVRGERDYRIAPLEPDPSRALFVERARAAGVELDQGPAVEEICRRLEGLPLAIELAAARVRLLPPDALLARLEPRLPLLVGGPHDLPDRQKTMRDAVGWSYQLLSAPAKALFRTLSVFAGGATLEAAEAVSGDPDFLANVGELVDASLAAAGTRLTMLETIREYGMAELEAAGEAAAVAARHTACFLSVAETGDPLPEQDNLRAALARALHEGQAEAAQRMCAALWQFWIDQGRLGEGLAWATDAVELPPSAGYFAALNGAARLAIARSAFDRARDWCDRLVELGEDPVTALNTRALLARVEDRYGAAIADHTRALALAERAGDTAGQAQALLGLSYSRFFEGESRPAYELAERGLAAARLAGSRRDAGEALLLLAWQSVHAGDHQAADRLAAEAVEVFRALHDARNTAESLRVLGMSAQMQDRFEQAAAYHEEALELYRRGGDERVAPQLLGHLAHVALATGDLPRARALAEESLVAARRFDDRWAIAMSATMLGHAELATGRAEAARTLFAEAAGLFLAIGNSIYLSWCLEGLAGVAAPADPVLAAQLCQARDALLATLEAGLPAVHAAGYAHTLRTIEAALAPGGVAAAREAGLAVPLEQLIDSVVVRPER